MVKRVKLEPDVAAEARDIWREGQVSRAATGRLPSVGFELEDNYVFIPIVDRGEFIAGVLYAFGEDISEAAEAESEDASELEDEDE
jgi:hypothetical protein